MPSKHGEALQCQDAAAQKTIKDGEPRLHEQQHDNPPKATITDTRLQRNQHRQDDIRTRHVRITSGILERLAIE